MAASNSPARRALAGILATLIGFVIAALAAEGLARLFFDEPVQPRFVVDPGYGVRWNEANVDTRHYSPGEYDVRVTTNSVGMRGPREYSLERRAGTRRIELLGDSFTFGFGVEDGEVVSAVLEDILCRSGASRDSGSGLAPLPQAPLPQAPLPQAPLPQLKPPPQTCPEVINLGVSGFGQAEEIVTWQNRGRPYRPDAVVILYFDNDIGNNVVAKLYSAQPDGTVLRTGKEYLPGARLQALLYTVAPVRWLFEHSQAWTLVRNRLSMLVQNAKLKEQGLKNFDDATPAGVTLTRALLGEFAREIRADGARPIFLVIPNEGLVSNFPLTAEEVAALGAQLVDGRGFLTPADYYRTDGHWRASGHRKAAAALAAAIE